MIVGRGGNMEVDLALEIALERVAAQKPHEPVHGYLRASGVAEDERDGVRQLAPLVHLGFESFAAAGREAIELRVAARGRSAPLAAEHSLVLEAVERWIQ